MIEKKQKEEKREENEISNPTVNKWTNSDDGIIFGKTYNLDIQILLHQL